MRRRLVIRVGTYSSAERFGAKETWLYIEHAEGEGGRGGECSRRRRGLRNEAMRASVTCGLYNPIVAVGIDGDEGLVLF